MRANGKQGKKLVTILIVAAGLIVAVGGHFLVAALGVVAVIIVVAIVDAVRARSMKRQ
jgi:cytochrome c oxidase subunit IV